MKVQLNKTMHSEVGDLVDGLNRIFKIRCCPTTLFKPYFLQIKD